MQIRFDASLRFDVANLRKNLEVTEVKIPRIESNP
jgi:hypothetical protein